MQSLSGCFNEATVGPEYKSDMNRLNNNLPELGNTAAGYGPVKFQFSFFMDLFNYAIYLIVGFGLGHS